jgi:hypothetical protein
MNANGQIVVPVRFTHTGSFSSGLAPASELNVSGSEVYGYIGKTGSWIIPPQYSAASPFENGLAAVRRVGINRYGYIDITGKEVIEPRFEELGPYRGDISAAGIVIGENGKDILEATERPTIQDWVELLFKSRAQPHR